jgi:hypothetical protein
MCNQIAICTKPSTIENPVARLIRSLDCHAIEPVPYHIEYYCRSSYAKSQADSSAMSFELFNTCKLHDRRTNILQPLSCQVGACDVLDI